MTTSQCSPRPSTRRRWCSAEGTLPGLLAVTAERSALTATAPAPCVRISEQGPGPAIRVNTRGFNGLAPCAARRGGKRRVSPQRASGAFCQLVHAFLGGSLLRSAWHEGAADAAFIISWQLRPRNAQLDRGSSYRCRLFAHCLGDEQSVKREDDARKAAARAAWSATCFKRDRYLPRTM